MKLTSPTIRKVDTGVLAMHSWIMSATVDIVFEEAKKLGSEEIEELMGRLAEFSDEAERLNEHDQVVEELRARVGGPFEPLDTEEQRQAMRERVVAKGKMILQERYRESE